MAPVARIGDPGLGICAEDEPERPEDGAAEAEDELQKVGGPRAHLPD